MSQQIFFENVCLLSGRFLDLSLLVVNQLLFLVFLNCFCAYGRVGGGGGAQNVLWLSFGFFFTLLSSTQVLLAEYPLNNCCFQCLFNARNCVFQFFSLN